MIARKRLAVVSVDESIDLLAILMGRVLRLQEAQEKPADVALELEEIVQVALARYQTARQDDMVMQAALDVLRYLPARTENEVRFLLQCAEQGQDEQVVMACMIALQYADTKQAGVKKALSEGRRSSHRAVREVVARLLRK
jgi:glutamine synthetase